MSIYLFGVVSAVTVGALGSYYLERSQREVFLLRRKADRLLRNVLPEAIAELLQDREERIAERFDAATVLFGDLVGFTTMAQELAPEELVAKLDEIFSELDDMSGTASRRSRRSVTRTWWSAACPRREVITRRRSSRCHARCSRR